MFHATLEQQSKTSVSQSVLYDVFQKNPIHLIHQFVNSFDSQSGSILYDVFRTNSIYGQGGIDSSPDTVVLVGWLGG